MDLYGRTGYAKTIDSAHLEVRKEKEKIGNVMEGHPLQSPDDDPLHYLEAVVSGQIEEGNSLQSLKNNVLVAEMLGRGTPVCADGQDHFSSLGGQIGNSAFSY